jgi:hypothetical protein
MIVKIETYFEISGPGLNNLPLDLIRKVVKERISSQRLEFLFKNNLPDEVVTNRIVQLTESEAFEKLSTSLSSKKK